MTFACKSGEERRLFARRVATADDQHVLVSEERTVARRTRGDTTTLLFFFTGRTQPHGFSAGADNDGMRQEGFALDHHFERSLTQVNFVHVAVLHLEAEPFRLLSKLHHHLRTTDAFGYPGKFSMSLVSMS